MANLLVNTPGIPGTELKPATADAEVRGFAELLKHSTPRLLVNRFNVPAPGVNTDILPNPIEPTVTPSICRVTVLLATASVFKARITRGPTTFDADFNSGVALVADGLYVFDVPWEAGDEVNFRVETDGVINLLKAHEVGG